MSLQTTDPIADLLTRIRNAIAVGKSEVRVPLSKIKLTIANQLKRFNYLADVKVEDGDPYKNIVITLTNPGENSPITEITRISKPGRRMYVKSDEIPVIKNGRGLVLISTSRGVMSGYEAKKEHLGGELILKIY